MDSTQKNVHKEKAPVVLSNWAHSHSNAFSYRNVRAYKTPNKNKRMFTKPPPKISKKSSKKDKESQKYSNSYHLNKLKTKHLTPFNFEAQQTERCKNEDITLL